MAKGPTCPLLGKGCIERDCRFWIQVMGQHPQTGEQLCRWDCAVVWLPVLLIENSQQQRQTGAAVESFRNEMVRDNQRAAELLAAQQRLLSGH